MRGDIVLFRSTGLWYERAITLGTHGPFVHVEIDLGDGQLIGAHLDGIVQHPFVPGPNAVYVRPQVLQEDLEYGLKWAVLQVGTRYGWADIFSHALKLAGIPFDVSEPGHWCCSDYVTRYLLVARAAGPLGVLAETPGLVSPNDLARAFGVK